jgi:hypothetical protein
MNGGDSVADPDPLTLTAVAIGTAGAAIGGGIALASRSKVPAPPPLPPAPTRLGDEKGISEAARRERARHAAAQGRASTILGGTTTESRPFTKTLLGG